MRSKQSDQRPIHYKQKPCSYPPAEARLARAEPEKIKMEFKFTFQEYMKLALCKAIPQAGIIIDPQEGFIFGPKEDCLRLKKKVERELSAKQYKKVELRREHDLDDLQYELDSKFSARIFRPAYIQKALATLSLYNCFQAPCTKFREILHKKIIVILRINIKFGKECMQSLEEILRRSIAVQAQRQKQQTVRYCAIESRPVSRPAYQEEEEYQVVEEEEVNYYQMKEQSQAKQEPQKNPGQSQPLSESSFSWIKTESSQLTEDEQDELNTSCILEDSRSFA